MNSKKNTITTIVFIVLFAVLIFGAYFGVKKIADKRSQEKAEQEAEPTEIEKILAIDITASYPETVRSVLKLYGRIVSGIHNETLEEGQLTSLQMQLRKLYDTEFLENNPIPQHYEALKTEVFEYDEKNRTIDSYLVDTANNAEYSTVEGQKYCRMIISFSLKEKGFVYKIFEEFLLRQDESGKWKILGWRLVDENGMPVK